MTDAVIVGGIGGWDPNYDQRRISSILLDGLGIPSDVVSEHIHLGLSDMLLQAPNDSDLVLLQEDLSGPIGRMRRKANLVDSVYWLRLSDELATAGMNGALFAVLTRGHDRLFQPAETYETSATLEQWRIPPAVPEHAG
jgi:hypothetical protein